MENRHLKIMVVEDDESLRKAILVKLKQENIDVTDFESGQLALNYLNDLASTSQYPDVIWLDFYVKDINGLEFMRQLKNNPQLLGIPVVVVSNSASPEKVNQMLDLGAKKYILKAESKLDDILNTIKSLIEV
jgi:CheY-like chemotaxis protein